MDKIPSPNLNEIAEYFIDFSAIEEIDHMDDEMLLVMDEMDFSNFKGVVIIENVMGISFSMFSKCYPACKEVIENTENLSDDEFKEKFEEINAATRIILCLNGEINSAFNRRLRMLQLGLIPNLEEELHFVGLICMKFKKSSVAWHYRKTVLKQFMAMYAGQKADLIKILDSENQFLEKLLKKYPRNYYGSSYKRFLVEEILVKNKMDDLLLLEFIKQKEFCTKNVHDYSAFHVLAFMFEELKDKLDRKQEQLWINNLIQEYEQMYSLERKDPSNLEVKLYELEAAKKYLKFLEKNLL